MWRKARDVVTFKTGKLDSNAAVEGGSYPFFTCSQSTLRIDKFAFDTECVLLAGNNAAGVFPLKYFRGKFNAYQRTYVIEPIDSRVLNIRYFYYFLKPLLKGFEQQATGATTKFLTLKILNQVDVWVPPLETQRKIAGILSAYDDLIENNRRRIAILERMAEELYREWFVRMRFPGYQNTKFVKGVPEGWEATYASNLYQIMGGGTPQTENSNYWDGEIPFFTPKDAPDNYVVFDTEKTITPDGLDSCSSRLFPEGTIFITARGTVGKIAIAGCDMAMNQSCYALKPKMQGSDALIFHFLTLRLAVAYFKGMSNSGVFDNIVTDTFKIIPMMWPGEQLIKQFHVFAHPLVSKAARLIQINKHLTQSRNSLLGRLISGKATTDGLQVLLPPSQSAGDDPLTNATELAHA